MIVRLDTPPGFSFRRTVLSHGWCLLPPFRVSRRGDRLATTVAVPGGGAAPVELAPDDDGAVALRSPGRPSAAVRRHLAAAGRRMLNLDLDLSEFHERSREAGLDWIADSGAGRLLRCPSAFEDLVKLLLTTNCSWALTERMVGNLVDRWGEPAPDGSRSFPGPRALARVRAHTLRVHARTGYRAPFLARLGRDVAAGRVEPESWENGAGNTAELKRRVLAIPGAGPYVAENVLKLLGRPDGLALDSWMRAKYARMFHGGRRVGDRTIERRYRAFGRWAGLAVWCELTRDWFERGEPSKAWENLE